MRKIMIAPSILSADFNNLKRDIDEVEKLGCEYLHFDVMDGHFVNNISFGVPVLKSISKSHKMINDVHLMISEPKRYALKFIEAGADIITFHLEAVKTDEEVNELIDLIHENKAKVGISIKPNTPAVSLLPFINKIDLILIMSVEPGFGGQSFMVEALDKISYLRNYIDEHHLSCLIEVDGGINKETAFDCKESGVDILVAGSYIFNSDNYKERVDALR